MDVKVVNFQTGSGECGLTIGKTSICDEILVCGAALILEDDYGDPSVLYKGEYEVIDDNA